MVFGIAGIPGLDCFEVRYQKNTIHSYIEKRSRSDSKTLEKRYFLSNISIFYTYQHKDFKYISCLNHV